jgi:cysteinyl-tRNA synthetase
MVLKLFNTLSRKKEEFKPIKKGEVGLYCCGPTVYWHQHIGNLRTYLFEDVLKRILLYNRLKVKHVINVTDVGHLTSDADEGEDKLVKALKREGLPLNKESMLKLANMYWEEFKQDFERLHILSPDVWSKATEHIPEMIELVKRIEKNGHTYSAGGNLYYDISKYKDYAKLAKLRLEEQKAGARVEAVEEKKNPQDFVLWFTKSKFEGHIMLWDSPWGTGWPGWHLECSAMSMKYLGDHFDIHCGGVDHIGVHHTNEIAQSEGATGKKWVNYWLHGEFLVSEKEKMSKSLGGFLTISSLMEKGYDPLVYRYFCLSAHYRSKLFFSWEAMDGAKNSFESFRNKILEIKDDLSSKPKDNDYKNNFKDAINDDMNMPIALSVVWAVIKDQDMGNKEKYDLLLDFDKVLGFNIEDMKRVEISDDIQKLVDEREAARKAKDFKKADEIRDKLQSQGIVLEDTSKGVRWKKA